MCRPSRRRVPVRRAGNRVAVLARGLEATSPLAVLSRGYSVTSLPGGEALTDARAARPGDELVTRLARGSLRSRVEGVEPGAPDGDAPA